MSSGKETLLGSAGERGPGLRCCGLRFNKRIVLALLALGAILLWVTIAQLDLKPHEVLCNPSVLLYSLQNNIF
jgi:hypothetical protein